MTNGGLLGNSGARQLWTTEVFHAELYGGHDQVYLQVMIGYFFEGTYDPD